MSATGLRVFDHTVQETNVWLNRIGERLPTGDRHCAYAALRAVLHALRDRLNVGANAHLSAQLPMLVRGVYFEGWRPGHGELDRTELQFIERVNKDLPDGFGYSAQDAVQAVFGVMNVVIDAGEVSKVLKSLPAEIRHLWPG